MKKFPKIFIVVLNYNGKDTIIECLKSVYLSEYPNYELIVADNDSKDGSFEIAKQYFSNAHFIQNADNLGFAAGNNTAIRYALEKFADYIFLLNNDAIIEKDTLSKLVQATESSRKKGIMSPVIFDGQNRVWFAGGKIKWLSMKAAHDFEVKADIPYETGYASGCAMLIKKEVFREIGLFDEDYFLYYEDADFCLRAKKEGFTCFVNPDAVAYHRETSRQDLSGKTYWLVLSGLIFFQKNAPLYFKPWMAIYKFFRKLKNRRDIASGKNELTEIVQRAYMDFKKLKI